MLFFFELFLIVLAMLTLALGEFVGRWLALVLWLVVTAFALLGYVFARASVASMAVGAGRAATPEPQQVREERERPEEPNTSDVTTRSDLPDLDARAQERERQRLAAFDEKWASTLLYNWRRSNVLLIVGSVAVAAWYWLGG